MHMMYVLDVLSFMAVLGHFCTLMLPSSIILQQPAEGIAHIMQFIYCVYLLERSHWRETRHQRYECGTNSDAQKFTLVDVSSASV